MKITEKEKELFKQFLSKQGITIDFYLVIKSIADSIDNYLNNCDDFGISAHLIIFRTINCQRLSGNSFWRYHHKSWINFFEKEMKRK